jgi:TPR repeat protein
MLKPILAVAFLSVGLPALAQDAPPEQLCDHLASHPWEPGNDGRRGVAWYDLDVAQAIPACRKALAAYPDAPEIQFRLARVLVRAGAVEEGLPLMLAAAQAGYSPAEAAYGNYHLPFQPGPFDLAVALEWLTKGAKHGNPVAQYDLAKMLMNGQGTPTDLAGAVHWTTLATETRYPPAMGLLGMMYEFGIGVERNYELAVEWYGDGSANNDDFSFFALARAFQLGRGVRYDAGAAYDRLHGYAMTGNTYAQLAIGMAHETGRGVPADLAEAQFWYGQAIDANYAPAMLARGRMLLASATTDDETAVALAWLQRAALGDQHEAYIILAEHYEAAGDFRSAREMAELAVYFSQGPLARLGEAVLARIGDRAPWPTTPGRFAMGSGARTANEPVTPPSRDMLAPSPDR